ncbi:MAG: RdgB/HAM1 family non-canonical purine NTP pyrophosphatase [Pseudomonadota bacterium]
MRKLLEKEIVVASHNAGKVKEINNLIAPYGFHAKSASQLNLPEPEETGTTFEENSLIKAHSACQETGLPALADDSGLCVDGLDGAPGVYTADWAEKPDGSGRDFYLAMEKVHNELDARNALNSSARFVAVLCLVWPDGHKEFFRGEVEGKIVWPPRGTLGFGYDPIFQPEGYEQTFGEMTVDEKHAWDASRSDDGLSHRARAFAQFARACLAG